jgi:hypothetical protein
VRKLYGVGLAALLCLTSLTGCGGGGVAEVEGAVTYDGQPVSPGIVSFLPADAGGKQGGGAILKGKYRVYPESVLRPGKYRVEIRWAKPTGEKREVGYGQSPDVVVEGLPDKYNSQSTLTAELKAGKNKLDFNLEK